MSFACLCVTLLICGYYCTATVSSHCPDYNNFDVCEDDEPDRLQVSFVGTYLTLSRNANPSNLDMMHVVRRLQIAAEFLATTNPNYNSKSNHKARFTAIGNATQCNVPYRKFAMQRSVPQCPLCTI